MQETASGLLFKTLRGKLFHKTAAAAAAAGGSEQVVPNRADLPPDSWPDSDTTYPLLSEGGSEITPTGLHT